MKNPVITGEPAPGGECRVCGGKLSESLTCAQCGAAFGEANRCPHCRSVADTEPSDALRHRCRVCGGPRVPLEDPRIVRSGREIPLLEQARRAQLRGAGWMVGSGVVGGFGVLSLLVVLLVLSVASPGIVASIAALGATAIPFIVAMISWRKARSAKQERERSLDEAWGLVAADVLSQRGDELTADELAADLRIDLPVAEQLLAQLSVNDFVRARVTDDGDLAYSVPATRLRIEDAELDGLADADAEQEESVVRAKAAAEREN